MFTTHKSDTTVCRARERKSASAPPSNCSANYYAKIAEILATHDKLFWPTLYYSAHLRRFHQETIKVEGKRKDGWMDEREFSHSIVATVTLGTIIVSMTLRAVG